MFCYCGSLGHNLWDIYHFVRSVGNNIEKVLKRFTYAIGIEIHRDRSRGLLGLSQKNYIEKVLKRSNMQNCSSSVAPVVKGYIFCELQCPKNDLEKKQMDKIPYASTVWSIMYA